MLDSIAGQDMRPGRPPARGPSVDSQIILSARGRLRRALQAGYENVYDRSNRDDVFATSLTGEGRTAFDAAAGRLVCVAATASAFSICQTAIKREISCQRFGPTG